MYFALLLVDFFCTIYFIICGEPLTVYPHQNPSLLTIKSVAYFAQKTSLTEVF